PQYSESTKTYELGNGLWKGCMTKADRRYIEFHARSAFSFLEGASLPEELIARCAEFQMPAMALLDRDGVYGAPRFHMTAKKLGIRAHIGAEISLQDFGALENPPLRGAATLEAVKKLPGEGAASPMDLATCCELYGDGVPSRRIPRNFEFFHS